MVTTDFLIIGAGMAGTSVACELAASASVIVIEQEDQPGYHATGRSAALFSEIYGNATIRALSRSSREALFKPAAEFWHEPFVRPRGALFIAGPDQRPALDAFRAMPDVECGTRLLSGHDALALVPILREGRAALAAYEPSAMDLDVHGLQQAYVKRLRARGAQVRCQSAVTAIKRQGGRWRVDTTIGPISANVVINAAGAWADEIAGMAGLPGVGLIPKRRTALLIEAPKGACIDSWPIVIDIEETLYFKPDAGKLLLSPADETPSQPCDAQPDDIDVAIAVDRFEGTTTLTVDRVTHRWAGLRSFVPDRGPVVGFDPLTTGFFWVAAQGGYGIQIAPALARAAAALALGRQLPCDISEQGVSVSALSPQRLQRETYPAPIAMP